MNWFGWALLSALFAGLTALLAKLGVERVDSNLATAIRTTVVVPLAWGVVLLTGWPDFKNLTSRTWLFLVLSGLATGASWFCYFRALQIGKLSRVAPVDKLSIVVAMVLAVIILGERMSWYHWVAGLLIVAGTVLLAYMG